MLRGGFEEGVDHKYCEEALKALVKPVHLLGIKWHLLFKNLLYRSLRFYFSQETCPSSAVSSPLIEDVLVLITSTSLEITFHINLNCEKII